MHLTESDLKFVVETVATKRRDHDHVIGLVRDKDYGAARVILRRGEEALANKAAE